MIPLSFIDPEVIAEQITVTKFKNGAECTTVNGVYEHIKYNTGDQIWLKFDGGKYRVAFYATHDGLLWREVYKK